MTTLTTTSAAAELSPTTCTTATFNTKARDLDPSLPVDPVYIRYWQDVYNPKFERHEALFFCFRTAAMQLTESDFLGNWFQGALENFKQ